jgi:hypothetical protein
MNDTGFDAAAQLAAASRFEARARHEARWYVRFLALFGCASLALASAFAFLDPLVAVAVTTPLWCLFVGGLCWWAVTRRVAVRGYASLHLTVMGAWGAAWVVTVMVGANWLPDVWQWWFGGGLAMALVAFTGAGIAYPRSRA